MRIFHGFDNLPAFRNASVTVGSFDGVHCGHRQLLDRVRLSAEASGGESVVLTFEPHPRVTLGKDTGLKLLTSLEEKAYLLDQAEVDNLIVIPFNTRFSRLTPYDFVRDYLIGRVGARELVVGFNHRFGHDKEGNFDYLDHLRREFGFNVTEVSECDVDSLKVSSTVVRRLIAEGEMDKAQKLLSHPYIIFGEIIDEGRVALKEPLKLLPCPGVYNAEIDGHPVTLSVSGNTIHITTDGIRSGDAFIIFR